MTTGDPSGSPQVAYRAVRPSASSSRWPSLGTRAILRHLLVASRFGRSGLIRSFAKHDAICRNLVRTSHNSVKAKFSVALLHPAQERQRGSKKRGRPAKRRKEEREDRPNAVTLITLRLPRELRLCHVTIISYTRWPFLFLNRCLAPVQTVQDRRRVDGAPRGIMCHNSG